MKNILLVLAALISTPAYASQIIVSNKARSLTYFADDGHVDKFPVAVGKPGAMFTGSYFIDRKAEWPTWTPTPHMCGKPRCKTVAGGKHNPLGARAMYLVQADGKQTLYRIHGTTNPKSIGHYASHGCIRMLNKDVMTLYSEVPVGTTVVVQKD